MSSSSSEIGLFEKWDAIFGERKLHIRCSKQQKESAGIPQNDAYYRKLETQFFQGWGAPASAVFPQLISWTASKDSGIKYFSVTATYNKTFLFSEPASSLKGKSVYLELGKLAKVGEVWLNGKSLSITWSLPHRFDITDEIRNGENTLKIEVVNT